MGGYGGAGLDAEPGVTVVDMASNGRIRSRQVSCSGSGVVQRVSWGVSVVVDSPPSCIVRSLWVGTLIAWL